MARRLWIITLFPDMFQAFVEQGLIGQALKKKTPIEIKFLQLRNFSPNDYKGVDDTPFGGGPGMVIRADVLEHALIEGIGRPMGWENIRDHIHLILPGPRGPRFNQQMAHRWAKDWSEKEGKDLVMVCGRYEGIDERFIEKYVDEHMSLGDFILSGGELAVMSMVDAVMRLMPGVLGNLDSTQSESYEQGMIEYPHFTRPRSFAGIDVPEVLLSGNHQKIRDWREQQSEVMTKKYRPDLWSEKTKDQKNGSNLSKGKK